MSDYKKAAQLLRSWLDEKHDVDDSAISEALVSIERVQMHEPMSTQEKPEHAIGRSAGGGLVTEAQEKPPREPQTWCLEPDYEGREGDADELYWGYALNYDPQQGPLNIQANRVKVIEYSAYESLRQQNAYLQQNYAEARDNQNIVQARLDEMRRERDEFKRMLKEESRNHDRLESKLKNKLDEARADQTRLMRDMGIHVMSIDKLIDERDALKAENERLRESLKHDTDKIEAQYSAQLAEANERLSQLAIAVEKANGIIQQRDKALERVADCEKTIALQAGKVLELTQNRIQETARFEEATAALSLIQSKCGIADAGDACREIMRFARETLAKLRGEGKA